MRRGSGSGKGEGEGKGRGMKEGEGRRKGRTPQCLKCVDANVNSFRLAGAVSKYRDDIK